MLSRPPGESPSLHDPVQGLAGSGEWAGVGGAIGQNLAPTGDDAARSRSVGVACGLLAILAALATLVAAPGPGQVSDGFAALAALLAVTALARLAASVSGHRR